MPGYASPTEFIATQAPLPDTFNAFWQMVWEQNARIIVTVTQLQEGGRIKCHKYWPEEEEAQVCVRHLVWWFIPRDCS